MRGTFTSRGLRLAYREEGRGLPLLLLHAFPLSGLMWNPQVEALAAVCRCIVPDLSGFGDSEVSPGGVSRMSDLAADAAALLDHLGIERAVLGGLSMGGYAALAFCESHADRLRGLVLADTRAGADPEEARRRRLDLAEKVLKEGSGSLTEGLMPKLLSPRTRAERPDLRERVEGWIAAAPPAGVAAAQRGMAERPDRSGALRRIAAPTLILVGEEDEVTPPDEARRMREEIPGAGLSILAGAGHLANLERPDAFNDALESFLRRLA